MIEEIKNSDFTDVLNSKLAVVDFSAVWCGPCQEAKQMILTEEKTYIINVTEVNTDAELGLNKKDIMIKYTNLDRKSVV